MTRALERCGAKVCGEGRACWSLNLGNGKPFPVTAGWEAPWLRLRAPIVRTIHAEAPWQLLVQNGQLLGAARTVRNEHDGGFVLQADLPFHNVALVDQRLAAACESLRGAAAAGPTDDAVERHSHLGDETDADSSWVQLGREHGWHLEPRAEQRLAVDLDTPGVMSQAFVEHRGTERCIWTEALAPGTLSEQSRRAIALFVLTATARLRMVRGSSTEADNPAVRLEVRMPAEPTGDELNLALSALSLACRWCSLELRGLSDKRLAGIYLDHVMTEEPIMFDHTIGED